jgi:hypothetical protein
VGPVADSEEALGVLGQRHADHDSTGLANHALATDWPTACPVPVSGFARLLDRHISVDGSGRCACRVSHDHGPLGTLPNAARPRILHGLKQM